MAKKTTKKTAKSTKATKSSAEFSKRVAAALKILAKSKELTTQQVRDKYDPKTQTRLGFGRTLHQMEEEGYVTSATYEGDRAVYWSITAKGRTAAKKA